MYEVAPWPRGPGTVPLIEEGEEGFHRMAASPDGRMVALAAWNAVWWIDARDLRRVRRETIDASIEWLAVGDDRTPSDRLACAPAAWLWCAAGPQGDVTLGDAWSGCGLVERRDLLDVGGVQRFAGAIEGWGTWRDAMIATVGPVLLPSAPVLAAAHTSGLLRRRLAQVRGHRAPRPVR